MFADWFEGHSPFRRSPSTVTLLSGDNRHQTTTFLAHWSLRRWERKKTRLRTPEKVAVRLRNFYILLYILKMISFPKGLSQILVAWAHLPTVEFPTLTKATSAPVESSCANSLNCTLSECPCNSPRIQRWCNTTDCTFGAHSSTRLTEGINCASHAERRMFLGPQEWTTGYD